MEAKYKIGDVLSTSATIEGGVCCGPTPRSGISTIKGGSHSFTNDKVKYIYFNTNENNYWYTFDNHGNYYEEKGLELVVVTKKSASKGEMLIEEAKRRWKKGDIVKSLPWPSNGAMWGPTGKSDRYYNCSLRSIYYHGHDSPFWYDEENDTLTNWGNGLGLLYHKGRWAGDPEINYQIY